MEVYSYIDRTDLLSDRYVPLILSGMSCYDEFYHTRTLKFRLMRIFNFHSVATIDPPQVFNQIEKKHHFHCFANVRDCISRLSTDQPCHNIWIRNVTIAATPIVEGNWGWKHHWISWEDETWDDQTCTLI